MPYKDPDKRRASQRKYSKDWYARNTDQHVQLVRDRKKKLRQWMLDKKNELFCIQCKENHPACLEFHHRDSDQKDFNISTAVANGLSIDNIEKEIAKCDVLCSNCHRKLHWDMV